MATDSRSDAEGAVRLGNVAMGGNVPVLTATATAAAVGVAASAATDDADMIVDTAAGIVSPATSIGGACMAVDTAVGVTIPADMADDAAVGVVVRAVAAGDTAVDVYGVGESLQSDDGVAADMGIFAITLGGTMAVDQGATTETQSRHDGSKGTGSSPPKRRNGRNSEARRARNVHDTTVRSLTVTPTSGHPAHRYCPNHGASREV